MLQRRYDQLTEIRKDNHMLFRKPRIMKKSHIKQLIETHLWLKIEKEMQAFMKLTTAK